MKISTITPVSFTPDSNRIDTGIQNFDIRKLYAIINMTEGEVIYATASNTKGFTSISDLGVITLQYDVSAHRADDIIQVLYEDNTESKLLETLLYFISAMAEKMPRVDDKDRQIVSVETGSIGVTSLPTLNIVGAVQNFSGGNTSAIPTHIANMGANYIYDQIKVTP